jgi:two-component system KDP operon response regulator KdpE
VITHGQLLARGLGISRPRSDAYLRDQAFAALRRKIEADPARLRWLVTEQGVGYRFIDE